MQICANEVAHYEHHEAPKAVEPEMVACHNDAEQGGCRI
jgi:hypothetical protein